MLRGMNARTKEEVALIAAERMHELRHTTATLAAAAGVDFNTVRDFINGKRKPNEANRVKLNDALLWSPGGLHGLYEGREVTKVDPPPGPPLLTVSDAELVAEVERRLKEAQHVMATSQIPGTPRETDQDEEGDLGRAGGAKTDSAAARTRRAFRRQSADKRDDG